MPKVSVVVPIYNVEDYLEKCINSLVNQTLQDIEIILVNDGSTDNSKEIAKKFEENYKDKIIYVEKENGGLSDARNFGLKYVTGEYVAFLDSDDYVEDNIYEEMYNKAILENADYVECDFWWEYKDRLEEDKGKQFKDKNEMLAFVRVVAWNKLIKTKIIKENEILFPKGLRYEDIEFTYKLIPYLKKCVLLDKPKIHYIQRDDSIVKVQNEKTIQILEVIDNVIKFYKQNKFYEEYKEALEYAFSRILLCSSLKRICKIYDKKIREKALKDTFNFLYENFPNWKKNKILKNEKSKKNMYMKTINKYTYKIYTKILNKI